MKNSFFKFKQFTIYQDKCAMKVGTDGVLLGAWVNIGNAKKILDVGTGTGLIAIMIAQRSIATIEAIELDNSAYKQASENILKCPWSIRINPSHISFQEYYQDTQSSFDLLVCNPPFFKNSLKAQEKLRNLARHNDTLTNSDLLTGASVLLKPEARLAVIMPRIEGSALITEATKFGLFCIRKTYVRTKPNAESRRILMEFSKKPEPCIEDNLIIGGESENTYSQQYCQLTNDFYLATKAN